MSRRPDISTVTLFPFLAVLVCTMGSLILLLLVTTRRIRQDALHAREPSVAAVALAPVLEFDESLDPGEPTAAQPDEDPVTVLIAPEEEPVLPLFAPNPTAEERAREELSRRAAEQARELEWMKVEYERALQQRNEAQQRFNQEWADHVDALQRQGEAAAARILEMREDSADRDGELAAATITHEQLQSRSVSAATDLDALSEQLNAERVRQAAILEECVRMVDEIGRAEIANSQRSPELEIVPFDAVSGTERRPIIIECRADGLTFAAERITLTPDQLSGFTIQRNPLLAAVRALSEYWTAVDREEDPTSRKPYVLLIVRPRGITAYYVARILLKQLNDSFGYELVTDEEPVRWPDPDDGAVQACRDAVNALLDDRVRFTNQLRSGRFPIAGRFQFSDGQGRFQYDEMESMRESLQAGKWHDGPVGMVPRGVRRTAPRRFATSSSGPGPSHASGGQEPSTHMQDDSRSQPHTTASAFPADASPSRNAESPSPAQAGSPASTRSSAPAPFPADVRDAQELPFGRLPDPRFAAKRNAEGEETTRPKQSLFRDSLGLIGIEREVEIHLRTDRIDIDEDITIPIPAGAAKDRVQSIVTEALRAYIQTWDAPPPDFFWKPWLKYVVHPGGNQHYVRLKGFASQWKVRERAEYVLE